VPGAAEPGRRVAFVVGLASGGTVSHVSALADGCRAAGLEVSVLAPAQTLALLPVGMDVRVVRIGDRPRPDRDAVAIVRLRAGLAASQPDVVHAHGVRAGAFAALAIASLRGSGWAGPWPLGSEPAGSSPSGSRLRGLRLSASRLPDSGPRRRARPALAVTVHNAPPDGLPARLVFGLLERICARRADLLLCASPDLLERMRDRGAAAAEQFDVPARPAPAPTTADVAATRADLGAVDRPVVLAVARLAPQKGLDVLIDAAARWHDCDPRPLTVIAGDGPLAGDLRVRAREAGADVALLGARDDVPALLAVADVVVVPSRWEARALVIQEAMRSGRPIVATRVGGTPELTGAGGALLVPPDNAAALADAVMAVLDDASLAARLSSAARERSAALPTEQDAVRAALAIYARLAASRSAKRDAGRAR
jgi:glycosyltransferase involved in cell wall biosynthesis